MKRVRSWVLRAAGAAMILAGLTGPAPGNIGGCGGGASVANPVQHCRDEQFWRCRRDQFAGRIDDVQFNQCLAPIEASCSGRAWPPGCGPTPAQSEACITLLQRGDLATLTNEQLDMMFSECDLCP